MKIEVIIAVVGIVVFTMAFIAGLIALRESDTP
jgi:hypothetical protein